MFKNHLPPSTHLFLTGDLTSPFPFSTPLHQMVNIRRISGSRNPVEMTYYVQHNSVPLAGASAAKVLNTVDSQTMALTLGYFVQLQAEREHSTLLCLDEWAKGQKR